MSALSATVIVGVMLVVPVTVEATALKALVAAVCALEVDCCIIAGVTAASAAASAAELRSTRRCVATVKSSAIPARKMQEMRDNEKMIATLPLRSRKNRRNMVTPSRQEDFCVRVPCR